MKQVGQFQTDDPDRLTQQLDALQANVAQETSDIRLGYMPLFVPKFIAQGGDVFSLGQAVIFAGSAAASINVSPAANKAPGLMLVINQTSNSLTITPTSGALMDGSTARTVTGGMFFLFFDGTNWNSS